MKKNRIYDKVINGRENEIRNVKVSSPKLKTHG